MIYSRKPVCFNKRSIDRRIKNVSRGGNVARNANDATDLNINESIEKFQNQPKNEFAYRILLMYFTDLGEINFPLKIDFRIKCHVETDLKKLFESKNCLTPLIQFLPLSMLKLFLQKCPLFSTSKFF